MTQGTQGFQGSMVALVTPMQADGAIDYPALKRLIDFHVDHGTDAIVAVGTTGESATLTMDERCQVIQTVVDHSAGRLPVIAGTGANATAEAIELTRCAAAAGVDGCLLVTPYYNKPTQEGLYRHHRAIAEAVPVPQILYNVPGRTCCDMLPETVFRLAEIDNIIGIKDATGDFDRGETLIRQTPVEFSVFSGDDATAMELILRGARGDISVTANVAPQAMHEMCAAALAGDRQRAEALNSQLIPLHQGLFVETSPIPVKWAVQQLGLIEGGIRLPLVPLSAAHHETVMVAMRNAGVL